MRVTVLQMNPGHDKAANLAQAGQLAACALREDRAALIALPEMWACLGGTRETKFAAAEALPAPGSADPAGPAYQFLQDLARTRQVHVHGGSIAERVGDTLFNTTLVFDPQGREIARYRKIHLFDITTPDGAGYRESATYGGGNQLAMYRIGDLQVGCAICYDLRFPELFLALRRLGAELIVVPAAFTALTGRAHWAVLLRARAIETQCWIAAPATWGRHHEGDTPRDTFGQAIVCDPWGQVVATASDGIGWASARIDRELTARVRRDMPVLDHRRLA